MGYYEECAGVELIDSEDVTVSLREVFEDTLKCVGTITKRG